MTMSGRVRSTARASSTRICGLPDDLETHLGQKARQSLAQQQLVVRDHDPHGISAWTPWWPPDERIETVPSSAPTRSSRPAMLSAPGPSTSTSMTSRSSSRSTRTVAFRRPRAERRLGDHEVRRGLDPWIETNVGHRDDLERDRGSFSQHRDAGREAIGQLGRVDAVGDLAKIGKGLTQLDIDLGQVQRAQFIVGRRRAADERGRRPSTGRPDAAGLHRGGRVQAAGARRPPRRRSSPGRLEVFELYLRLRVQPLVFERQSGGRDRLAQTLGIVEKVGSMREQRDELGPTFDPGVSVRPASGTTSTRRPLASASRPSPPRMPVAGAGSPSVAASRSRSWPAGGESARSNTIWETCRLARRARKPSSSTPAAIAMIAAAWPYQSPMSTGSFDRLPRWKAWTASMATHTENTIAGSSTGAISRREAAVASNQTIGHQAESGRDPDDLEDQSHASGGGAQIRFRSNREEVVRTARASRGTRFEEERWHEAEHHDSGQIRCRDHGAGDRRSESPLRKRERGMDDQCGIGDAEDKSR